MEVETVCIQMTANGYSWTLEKKQKESDDEEKE